MNRQTKSFLLIASLAVSVCAFAATEWQRTTIPVYRSFSVEASTITAKAVSSSGKYLAIVRHRPGFYTTGEAGYELIVWNVPENRVYYRGVLSEGRANPDLKFSDNETSLNLRYYVGNGESLNLRTFVREDVPYTEPDAWDVSRSVRDRCRVYSSNPYSGDGKTYLEELATGKKVVVDETATRFHNMAFGSFTADGNYLYGQQLTPNDNADKAVFWSVKTGKQVPVPDWVPRRGERLIHLCETPDASTIATAWSDGRIVVTNTKTGTDRVYTFPDKIISWVAFRDNGRFLLARGGTKRFCEPGDDSCVSGKSEGKPYRYDWKIVVWDTVTGKSSVMEDGAPVSGNGFSLSDAGLRDLRGGREWRLLSGDGSKFTRNDRFIWGASQRYDERERKSHETVTFWQVPKR